MPIAKFENVTISKQSFIVEETCFINCVLQECHLFYSGGDVELVGGRMENCHWHFRGAAQRTMQTMQMIGMLAPPQTPIPMPPTNTSKMN